MVVKSDGCLRPEAPESAHAQRARTPAGQPATTPAREKRAVWGPRRDAGATVEHRFGGDGCYGVTGLDFAFGQDLGAEASTMAESFDYRLVGQALEMVARFAEADAADADGADGEFAVYEMI
jgi:hypothetical protein